ncbi:MAG: extracellular solute-binding protein [Chloroflexota bacterium]|nr:extracellular solute-binding protein [Chloroflexota bacterium]
MIHSSQEQHLPAGQGLAVLESEITRRSFIRKVAGATLVGAVGSALLAACGGAAAPSSSAPASKAAAPPSAPASKPAASVSVSAKPSAAASSAPASSAAASGGPIPHMAKMEKLLPSYQAVKGPKPDVDSGNPIIPNGYFSYPKQLFKAVPEPPGDGSDVTFMTELFQPLPAPLSDNPGWQAVNKALNANMKMTIVPFAQYNTKFATTVAGNDLPDMIFIPFPPIQDLPDFLEAKCEDLTPYLQGDAVKQYPNLANEPPISWRGTIYNNKIFGVTISLSSFFWVLWTHREMLEDAGLSTPKTADEFKNALIKLTKPEKSQWGIMSETGFQYAWDVTNGLWPSVFGAPQHWAIGPNGKFIRDWETEEFKASVGFARDLYAAKVYDPNSTTYNVISARSAFEQRKSAFRFDGLTSVTFDSGKKLNPPSKLEIIVPPASGGKGGYWFGPGNFGFVAFKKAKPDRIKLLLRICNFMASPFGSEESHLMAYGVKDVEYKDGPNGNPLLTDKGMAHAMPWGAPTGTAVTHGPQVYFDTNSPDFPKMVIPVEKDLYKVGISDPTVGLWSKTNGSIGTIPLFQKMGDGISDIVTGRRPMSDFDQLVKAWQSGGGEKIRGEYEKSYDALK